LVAILKDETAAISSSSDIVKVRQIVRAWAISLGFSLVEQTKMVTAASELARNTLDYGGGGVVQMQVLNNESRRGLKLTFSDEGPGIKDLEQAMKDGFTTGSGMGLGLGGAKRLVNEFEIDSAPGRGTKVMITRWRST
jgi:serine/threonine-protein kinase RsbT